MPPDEPTPEEAARAYKPRVSAKLNALLEGWTGEPNATLANVTDLQLMEASLRAQNELARRARAGRDTATDYTFRLAMRGVGVLNDLAKNPSPLLLLLAQEAPFWPAWYCPKASFLDEYKPVWKKLGIGTKSCWNVDSRSRWKLVGDVARMWACEIIDYVQTLQVDVDGHKTDFPGIEFQWNALTRAAYELPPRTKATVRRWMKEVGEPLIMQLTNGRPEAHPELKPIAASWQRRNASAKPGSRTLRTNLRRDIFRRIEQAMRDMSSEQ